MERQEFIDAWKHKLAGMILDGAIEHRTGGTLAFWARGIMKQSDEILAQMYDALKKPPATNGVKK